MERGKGGLDREEDLLANLGARREIGSMASQWMRVDKMETKTWLCVIGSGGKWDTYSKGYTEEVITKKCQRSAEDHSN